MENNFYLKKYGNNTPRLDVEIDSELGIIVVIPCHNEPNLIRTLASVLNCELPNCNTAVLVVINASERAEEHVLKQNEKTFQETSEWIKQNEMDSISFHLIVENALPKKHAGVGLARKIGMDEAVFLFDQINQDGVIVCFDADSQCEPNYLIEIEKHFAEHPKTPGCSIFYEHPIAGTEFDLPVYNGIVLYELFLRYYNLAMRFSGLPYTFQTVGSSMAVRSSAYQKQGGMNKRKAGEDFYFIHKIIQLGHFTELTSTKVIPSPRPSDRVPFGTGKAIADWLAEGNEHYLTYDFIIFEELQTMINRIGDWYSNDPINELPKSIASFLREMDYQKHLEEIRNNSASKEQFIKRFYRWFDAFKVLKFVHYARDNFYPNKNLVGECNAFLHKRFPTMVMQNDAKALLQLFREIERNDNYRN